MSYEDKTKEELIWIIDKLEEQYNDSVEEKDKWMTRANEYSETIDDRDDEICNLESTIDDLESNESLEWKLNEVYLSSLWGSDTKVLLENRRWVNIYLYVE